MDSYLRLGRPGSASVGLHIRSPTADLGLLETELLELEARIAQEGGRVVLVCGQIQNVVAIRGGPSFVRFARAYIDRTPSFQRVSLHVERSFVVRTIIDPLALFAPRMRIKSFATEDAAVAFGREVDPTLRGLTGSVTERTV